MDPGTVAGLTGWAAFLGLMAEDLIRETRDTMGKARRFKRERKLYRLQFETEDMDGFECIASGMSLERFIAFNALQEQVQSQEARESQAGEQLYTMFARQLVSWNLDDDDDQPVPCDYDGLKAQDVEFVNMLVQAWAKAIAGVPDDLGKDSDSGETSREESSLRLASLSDSRAS